MEASGGGSVSQENAPCGVHSMNVDPADWSYLAEGGFHIILRYEGTDPDLIGMVLRIGKESTEVTDEDGEACNGASPGDGGGENPVEAIGGGIATAAAKLSSAVVIPERHDGTSGKPSTDVSAEAMSESATPASVEPPSARRRFESSVLAPLLGQQYVQHGDAVTLGRDAIDRIRDSIEPLRPEGRIADDKGTWSSAAQVEPDKTAFWLRPPTSARGDAGKSLLGGRAMRNKAVIAVEVKPKGAIMPVSALVPPGPNRLKYRVNRFDAQQVFKAQGAQSWGSIDQPTGYDPRDFYSGDAARTARALKELVQTPQNKLRAWINGTLLVGSGAQNDEEGDVGATHLLGEAVKEAGLGHDGKSGEQALMDLIGVILAKEPLVSRLVAAQSLDVLEVEGGGLVFQRLVALCGDSREAALSLLEAREADKFNAEPVPIKESTRDIILPPAVLESLQRGETVDNLEELHGKATAAVTALGVDDCIHLLRRYLIALGVMDCSVMMSFVALEPGEVDHQAGGEVGGNGSSWTPQGGHTAGMLEHGGGNHVAYCVSVVDAGPKPPSKIASKAKHEHKIWEYLAESQQGRHTHD